MQKKLLALSCLLIVAACSEGPTGSNTPSTGALQVERSANARLVPGRYIVVFKSSVGDVSGEASRIVNVEGGKLQFVYEHALKGFAADLSDQAIQRLLKNPMVASISQDGFVHADITQSPTPSWGLDRIDQANLPLNNSYTYPGTGAGVHFYSIDTGVLGGINGTAATPHNDIAGRLSTGFDAILASNKSNDCNGHGTHTTTTAVGTTYGVAKGATVHPVRVLDCGGSGTFAQVIAGINWVTGDQQAHPGQLSVANMSLGGGLDQPTNTAVRNSIAAGVVYSLSAGNSFAANACTQSPAAVLEGLTVMAFDINDRIANFSNIGPCTDLGGPGVNITAGWIGGPNATNTISGTSMSAPHVAGVAVLYRAAHPSDAPPAVNAAIIANATNNIIKGVGGGAFPANTPNKNLNMSFLNGGGGGNTPPIASWTVSCQPAPAHVCTFDGRGSTDPGGSIVSYRWTNAGGKQVGILSNFTRTFERSAALRWTLTVTDNGGLTGTQTKSFTVP